MISQEFDRDQISPQNSNANPTRPVTYLLEALSLLALCLTLFVALDRVGFLLWLVAGILLGGGMWWACSRFSLLWNLRYQTKPLHHALCLMAAVLTVIFTVLFGSLKYAKEAAAASVVAWQGQIALDQIWSSATFATAYDAVKSLGLEDFSGVPPPGDRNVTIPTTQPASIITAARTYAAHAAEHFASNRPLLNLMTQSDTQIPQVVLEADINNHFANSGPVYDSAKAIALVADLNKQQIMPQLTQLVLYTRGLLAFAFLLTQSIPFGLVAWGAYRDIHVVT